VKPTVRWYDALVQYTPPPPFPRGTYRTTLTGVGAPGPIEERVGRRLVRLVDPDSREGLSLLRSGQVTFVGPEGAPLDCKRLDEAMALLRARLERLLAERDCDEARGVVLRDGLDRLSARRGRAGRA